MLRKAVLAALATAAVGTIALPRLAPADPVLGTPQTCVKLSDVTGPDFEVKQCGVSDVDQFRAGLEGDGATHCGPASLYNVLHYWGHVKKAPVGWLTTKVGDLDPEDPADHTVVGNSIDRVAADAGGPTTTVPARVACAPRGPSPPSPPGTPAGPPRPAASAPRPRPTSPVTWPRGSTRVRSRPGTAATRPVPGTASSATVGTSSP